MCVCKRLTYIHEGRGKGGPQCTCMYSCVPELRVIMYAFMYAYDMTLYV